MSMHKMDGYNDCVTGVILRANQAPILCYDLEAILQRHVDDGMTREEAIEFFEFNQLGAWVGDGTPCFLDKDWKAYIPGGEL